MKDAAKLGRIRQISDQAKEGWLPFQRTRPNHEGSHPNNKNNFRGYQNLQVFKIWRFEELYQQIYMNENKHFPQISR